MKDKAFPGKRSSLGRVFLGIGIGWTAVIAILLTWEISDLRSNTTLVALSQARSFFKQIVLTRHWNASKGGVYVWTNRDNQPNPYLDVPDRDIETDKGRRLTLINPEYMARQLSEIAAQKEQIHFHLTSLKPINPGNTPDNWEARALKAFSKKMTEAYEWTPDKEAKNTFRYMSPLWVEAVCLRCHAKQGYSLGELRGGISVTIPADDLLASRDRRVRLIALSYFLIWSIGCCVLCVPFTLLRGQNRKLEGALAELQKSLAEIKVLRGLIPICASCKKIRNDKGYWEQIEAYISDHSEAEFTHSICPDCGKKLYPKYFRDKE